MDHARGSDAGSSTRGKRPSLIAICSRMGTDMAQVLSINVGRPRDIVWKGRSVHTAIWKDPVPGRSRVDRLNVEGDGQGDLAGHGGEQRAVFCLSARILLFTGRSDPSIPSRGRRKVQKCTSRFSDFPGRALSCTILPHEMHLQVLVYSSSWKNAATCAFDVTNTL